MFFARIGFDAGIGARFVWILHKLQQTVRIFAQCQSIFNIIRCEQHKSNLISSLFWEIFCSVRFLYGHLAGRGHMV